MIFKQFLLNLAGMWTRKNLLNFWADPTQKSQSASIVDLCYHLVLMEISSKVTVGRGIYS